MYSDSDCVYSERCTSKFYGIVYFGDIPEPRTIMCMSDGYYARYYNIIFRVEPMPSTDGKKRWKAVKGVYIIHKTHYLGTKVLMKCQGTSHVLTSNRGFISLERHNGVPIKILDLDNCTVHRLPNIE